jgi:hypothetical protein
MILRQSLAVPERVDLHLWVGAELADRLHAEVFRQEPERPSPEAEIQSLLEGWAAGIPETIADAGVVSITAVLDLAPWVRRVPWQPISADAGIRQLFPSPLLEF